MPDEIKDAQATLTYYRNLLKSVSKKLGALQVWIEEIDTEIEDVIYHMGPQPLVPPEEVRLADIEPYIVSPWNRKHAKEGS